MVRVKPFVPLIGLYLAYFNYRATNTNSPFVEISSGSLRGRVSVSREGREFYEYLGIPYAKPPKGSLRFEPPQPVEKWAGVRDAYSYGSTCLQADVGSRAIHGEEDCLFLNVFVPKRSNNNGNLFPTMLWIHGGMFSLGTSLMYRPEYFMDHYIILITINYRLGSLGFLSTGDEIVRGNMGLKDQNMALKWVQKNIREFGGDSNRVTIFGESAGAISAHHHMLSPLSRGLFERVISQSGVAVATWSARSNSAEQAKRFSERFGCPTENSTSMIECLRSINGQKLMEPTYADLKDDFREPITIFGPCIEEIKDKNAFIIEPPTEIIRKGNFSKAPWMVGINSEEGLVFSALLIHDSKLDKVAENFEVHLPNLLWHTGKKANPEGLQKIKEFYFGTNKFRSIDRFQNWTNILTDALFAAPTRRAIALHSEHSPVYSYFYSYKGRFTLTDFLLALPGKYPVVLEFLNYVIPRLFKRTFLGIQPQHYGACHFDEVVMQFPVRFYYIQPSDKDYQMSKNMVQAWVTFASHPDLSTLEFNGVKWPQARSPDGNKPLKYMHIDSQPGVIDEPNAERNEFWNTLVL